MEGKVSEKKVESEKWEEDCFCWFLLKHLMYMYVTYLEIITAQEEHAHPAAGYLCLTPNIQSSSLFSKTLWLREMITVELKTVIMFVIKRNHVCS